MRDRSLHLPGEAALLRRGILKPAAGVEEDPQQWDRKAKGPWFVTPGHPRHALTSDICGKRLMARGRASPKAARHTRLCTGSSIRGRDLSSEVLQGKGWVSVGKCQRPRKKKKIHPVLLPGCSQL